MTLDVIDDGRGFDVEWLLERARQDGFLEAGENTHLSGSELLQLICRPGFSTARRITETSGRGIGMEVVRHTVDKLGGTLQLLPGPGTGSLLPLYSATDGFHRAGTVGGGRRSNGSLAPHVDRANPGCASAAVALF